MKTIKINTAQLSGAALDWAVAVAIGKDPVLWDVCCGNTVGTPAECCLDPLVTVEVDMKRWEPSTDWSQGGPLIEKYGIGVAKFFEPIDGPVMVGMEWAALWIDDSVRMDGHAALVAACRAIVAAKLGDTVDVPADLVETTP